MLVEMPFGPFPMALGVIYDDPRPTFESALLDQDAKSREASTPISPSSSPRARPGPSAELLPIRFEFGFTRRHEVVGGF
jgi:hypothetical protein